MNLLTHLPDATKEALEKNAAGFAMGTGGFGSDLKRQGENFQVLKAGSVLVSPEDPRSGEKLLLPVHRVSGQASASGNAAPIVAASLAGGTKDNYKFSITGCGSQFVFTFPITAWPNEAGKRAFCVDHCGDFKYSALFVMPTAPEH